jgi:hypothetical protein
MLRPVLALGVLALLSSGAMAAEIACDGPFAADSSAQRLIETFGKDNVVTGDVDGPEGTTVLATTVFPNDPNRKMEFGWWDEDKLERVAYFTLPAEDTAPGGLKPGLTIKEVEALNGGPFKLGGFWWDYGGAANFDGGKLAEAPGGCVVSVQFEPKADIPADLDVSTISGEVEIDSTDPLLEKLDTRVVSVSIGYPDFSQSED